jgi:hypothetical protein
MPGLGPEEAVDVHACAQWPCACAWGLYSRGAGALTTSAPRLRRPGLQAH